jgi:hypothetical protein
MTNDNSQPNAKDHPAQDIPDQEMPEQTSQQAPQTKPTMASQPGQRAAPGRKPLFRS